MIFSPLNAATSTIQLAVYKDYAQLKSEISKITPEHYQKFVNVRQEGGLNYAKAVFSGNEDEIRSALRIYRKVFQDAFITGTHSGDLTPSLQAVSKTQSKADFQKASYGQPHNDRKMEAYLGRVEDEQRYTRMLAMKNPIYEKHVIEWEDQIRKNSGVMYLCYETGAQKEIALVIQAVYDHGQMTYLALTHKMKPMTTAYRCDEDTLLIMDAKQTKVLLQHKIIALKKGYIRAAVYQNGVKINTVRYYFDKKNALAFVAQKEKGE